MSRILRKIKNFFYKVFIGNRIMKNDEILDGERVWFISDMHFGDRNIIKWCRGEYFKNLYQMHQRMISNWNYHVGIFDRVFCLGDFGDFGFKQQLKGKITLAKGNHDNKQWNRQYILKYRDMKFLILHDPDNATNWFTGGWIIHGHTHVNSPFIDITNMRVNVSVEMINFTPISMESIYNIVKESANFKDDRWFL
jgi:calcineurin-like phosphoesterase family protein